MGKEKSLSARVPFHEAEPARNFLRERHLLRTDLALKKDKEFIYFPIKDVGDKVSSYTVVTTTFEKKVVQPRSYKDLLPQSIATILPTSYDVIGDIILIKLPMELRRYHKRIGAALLQTHRNVRTVCVVDPVQGELRTRNVTIIAGENRTITTHTEYGLSFQVDVQMAYFSPRLAAERRRVSRCVKPGEIVVDMFTGVAPFPIMMARYAQPRVVYAIDKNEKAVDLARQNVRQNHVLDVVEVIHADASDAPQIVPEKADRIIMNLPFSAHSFFSTALQISNTQCIIHYYDIIKEEDIEKRIDELKRIAGEHRFVLSDVQIHKIKTYAPREFYIGIDITATKLPT